MASANDRLDALIAGNGHHKSSQSRSSPRGGKKSFAPKPRRSASYDFENQSSNAQGFQSDRASPPNANAALDAIIAGGKPSHSKHTALGTHERPRRASTSDINGGFPGAPIPRKHRDPHPSFNSGQDPRPPVSHSANDYASEEDRYNKARLEKKAHDPKQGFNSTANRPPRPPSFSSHSTDHPDFSATNAYGQGHFGQPAQSSHRATPTSEDWSAPNRSAIPPRPHEPPSTPPRMSSTIDAFLGQILQSVSHRNGQALTGCIILDFDSLPQDRRQPYGDLHNELNQRYPATKDSALSTKVKQSLPSDQLLSCHSAFTESITQYFRYVRDYVNDSALLKARKIEKLTRQCIITLRDDPPGPIMIPLVLHLTSILRTVAINLDRDPTLTASTTQSTTTTEDEGTISFTENTANILREAFNKCIQRSRPTQPPTPNSLSSGTYLILNSCMSLYNRANKLRNAEFLLGTLDKTSPPLAYYPASQRVTYLYFLGKFHFAANHFHRAISALQSAYDQCMKGNSCINQRRLILIHLIAGGMCIGRLPSRILIVDQAAHAISGPFVELCGIIRSGDVGRLQVYLDHTVHGNTSAQWFLRKGILLQLRNRCEVLCWRSLILKTMRYAGNLGSQGSMPFVRFNAIADAARFSYARARGEVAGQSNGAFSLDEQENGYVDPDFADLEDEHEDGDEHQENENDSASTPGFGQSPTPMRTPSLEEADHKTNTDHLPLLDPTPDEINSIVLSLISQGFLKGFVAHTHPDLLQSRFAVPGIRSRASESSESAWREVGFPSVFGVVREKEMSVDEGDVPGWVTEEKVRKREEEKSRGGGGRVIRSTGFKPAGMS